MQLVHITSRAPALVQVLDILATKDGEVERSEVLLQELAGITALVAKKFTNDKTADGLLDAFYLTVGCISLALARANLPDSGDSRLAFLFQHGAERVFQMGFRHIKELATLPYVAFLSEFDNDPFIQQRNLKALFYEICRADPASSWRGDEVFTREYVDRQNNQQIVSCAKWLRAHHFAGPIKDTELDANAVIAIAIIFGIYGDGRIVARTGQKEIENLITFARKNLPDIDASWGSLLNLVPQNMHALLLERMQGYRTTIVKKIFSKAKIKTVVTEIQDFYAGNELDVEYP